MFRKVLFSLLILIINISVFAENYQSNILALYKSSDNQTDQENEMFWYLSIPLKNMGFTLKFWDIDKGLPQPSLLNKSRAIITWFRGGSMNNPGAYMDMLNKFIDSGKKVLVFDNFGAYMDRKTEKYMDMGLLNLTLARLGIMYLGDWTETGSLLSFAVKDSVMVEHEDKQDIKKSSFFFRFINVDEDMKVYLSLKRKDKEYDPSPVIVTNRNGGFVLSRYIYRVENNGLKMMLNIEEFLKEALFPKAVRIKIGLLADTSNDKIVKILKYTKELLKKVKISFKVILKKDIPSLLKYDLREFTAVGLILSDDSGINGETIKEFLKGGGGLTSLYGGGFFTLAPYLSIEPPPRNKTFNFNIKGYRFSYGFLMGEGLSLEDDKFSSESGYGVAAKKVKILAYDYANLKPLLWYAKKENGRVLTWNWDGFFTGEFLGMILESFLYVMPVGVSGTNSLAAMFLDDWPLSMYNVVKSPLAITDTEFYTKIWWPEIQAFFDKNSIPYSSYLIFNYNGKTEPPFTATEFFMGENMASVKVANQIIESRHELAFHGYNHMSLTLEETNMNPHKWPSVKNMRLSLEAAKFNWINLFGEHSLPLTYVAPHNIISEEGIRVLHDVFPSIKAISTLRAGNSEESHAEWGVHPEIEGIYMLPRTSSGYHFDKDVRRLIISGIEGAGIWSHFIHADDIFDPLRSGKKSWPQLKADFQKMINFVKHHYPWLEYKTVYDSYLALMKYDDTGVKFTWENNVLKVEARPGFRFRINQNSFKANKFKGVRVVYAYKRMDIFILENTDNLAEISFRNK